MTHGMPLSRIGPFTWYTPTGNTIQLFMSSVVTNTAPKEVAIWL
jgi:hypothetical protein